jgi:hypothetical protein
LLPAQDGLAKIDIALRPSASIFVALQVRAGWQFCFRILKGFSFAV